MDKDKVYFIKGISNDPYFNLASEEFLLRRTDGYFIYIWINAPAVIVGINQNTAEEVNLDYTESHGIKVVRRQTGGGAVYHDLNNVCYTIIAEYDGERDNYRYFTEGIIGYLKTLGINAEFSGRNDVVIDGMKISGNAQCVYKNRIMHHGTLLFDTDMSVLTSALKPHKLKIESKGIKSARARVTNIKNHLVKELTATQFYDGLADYFSAQAERYEFTAEDIAEIEKLRTEKYSTFAWNIGMSPTAKISAEEKFPYGLVKVNFDIEGGALQNVSFTGDFFSLKEVSALNHALNGVLYKKEELTAALNGVEKFIIGAKPEEIAELFFK